MAQELQVIGHALGGGSSNQNFSALNKVELSEKGLQEVGGMVWVNI